MNKRRYTVYSILLLAALFCLGLNSGHINTVQAAPTNGEQTTWNQERWDQATLPLPITIRKGRIIVRAESGLKKVATRIANSADSSLVKINADLKGLHTPERVEIRLVGRVENIAHASPHPNVPPWAVGVAFSRVGVIVAAQSRGPEVLDIDNTVSHELAHLAFGAALGERAPRWLNEGFAYLHSSDWSIERFRTLIGMAWSNNVISLDDIDRSFPRQEHAAHRAYAQSYDFVAFLARRGRYVDPRDDGNPWPFRRFLARIAQGDSPTEAAQSAFGVPLARLFGEWRHGLRSRYLLVPAEMFALGIWVLGALLLILGYLRRKRLNKKTLQRWEDEDRVRDAQHQAAIDIIHIAKLDINDSDEPVPTWLN